MIRWYPLLFLVLPAANCVHWRSDAERYGFTDAELNAKVPSTRLRGAILNDVIIWRGLRERLEEGRPGCSMVVQRDGVIICARDETAFEVFSLRAELPDEPYRAEETAYYCREESVYYYHYVGGRYRRNVWFGPFSLDRKRPKDPDE